MLAELLFVTHASGGELTMIDISSGRITPLASGGSRGDFIHVGPDNRIYVTQSGQVDVFTPLVAPEVVSMTPADGYEMQPPLRAATVTFNTDMWSSAGTGSVTNPANFRLVDLDRGNTLVLSTAVYDAQAAR